MPGTIAKSTARYIACLITHLFLFLLHKKADESNSAVGHELFQLKFGKYSATNHSHQQRRVQVMRYALGATGLPSTQFFINTSLAF